MMDRIDITSLTLVDAAALIRKKQISPVELTEACLRRIEGLDGELNCFITVTSDLAMEQARQAEADILRGSTIKGGPISPIHGTPIVLKDLFETRGILTSAGSRFFSDYYPKEDAEVVRRLSDAGAVLIGKTNLHEIALGLTSVNPHFGPVRNPWGKERVAGGSSGGSAAALAARFCPAALGTDTGGSIRVPAALCGVSGLKPTFGRVSRRGVVPLSWNLDHAGPLARCARDLAVLLQVIAGYDPLDPYSIHVSQENFSESIDDGVKGWRIALADGEFFQKTSTQIVKRVNEAARVFEALGAQVELTPFPGAYPAALANGLMVVADAAAFHADRLREHPENFGEDVRQRLETGARLDLADYIQARKTQTLMRREFEAFFDQHDLLLMPTTPVTAPLINGPDAVELARLLSRYTAPFNLTGLPAISIPCGFSDDGLPVGLQMIARPWGEALLLRAAFAFQNVTDWHSRQPEL